MSQDSDRVKRLVEIKEKLEKRVRRLESSLKDSQELLETVNALLLEKGFKHPQITKDALKPQPTEPEKTVIPEPNPVSLEGSSSTPESVIPLRAAGGELLAILHSTEDSLRVLPAEDKSFDVNTPPFTQFLVQCHPWLPPLSGLPSPSPMLSKISPFCLACPAQMTKCNLHPLCVNPQMPP